MDDTVIFLLVCLSSIFGALAAIPYLMTYDRKQENNKFKEFLNSGIVNGNLTSYVDLQHAAECWNQSRESVLYNLRLLNSQAIAGKNEVLTKKTGIIHNLLEEHQKIEPFSELPENISLQLDAIKNRLNETESEQITQLAASLSSLYTSNKDKILSGEKLNKRSFLVGVLGIIIGLSSLFF